MPLSAAGLWEAEMTIPAEKSFSRHNWETAGVGSTPPHTTRPPPAWMLDPIHSARSVVENRVSPASSTRGALRMAESSAATAAPSRLTVSSSSGGS